jgi:hypothetical protein
MPPSTRPRTIERWSAAALVLVACAAPARAPESPRARRPPTGCWRAALDGLAARLDRVHDATRAFEHAARDLAPDASAPLDDAPRAALAETAFAVALAVPDELLPYDPAAVGDLARSGEVLEEPPPAGVSRAAADRDALTLARAALGRIERVYQGALRQSETGVLWAFECRAIENAAARRARDRSLDGGATTAAPEPTPGFAATRDAAHRCLYTVRDDLAHGQQGAAFTDAAACLREIERTLAAYEEAVARFDEANELFRRLRVIHGRDRGLSRREGAMVRERFVTALDGATLAASDPEIAAALRAHADGVAGAGDRGARFAALEAIFTDLGVISDRIFTLLELQMSLECEPSPERCRVNPLGHR